MTDRCVLVPIALVALAFSSEVRAQRPVARVLEAKGLVVAADESKSRRLADFGTVYQQEKLQLAKDASAMLAFRGNGRLERIKGPIEVTVSETGCLPADKVEVVVVADKEATLKEAVMQLPPVTRSGATIVRHAPGMALPPLSPVNRSVVLATRPTFAWTPMPDVVAYELKMRSPAGVVWSTRTKKAAEPYAGEAPLADGTEYTWEVVIAEGDGAKRVLCRGSFSTATSKQREMAAQLAQMTVKPETSFLVLASLWFLEQRMIAEATDATQRLTNLAPKQAEYRLMLANLYDRADRPEDALEARAEAQKLGAETKPTGEQPDFFRRLKEKSRSKP